MKRAWAFGLAACLGTGLLAGCHKGAEVSGTASKEQVGAAVAPQNNMEQRQRDQASQMAAQMRQRAQQGGH